MDGERVEFLSASGEPSFWENGRWFTGLAGLRGPSARQAWHERPD